jgi:hypothetical protein
LTVLLNNTWFAPGIWGILIVAMASYQITYNWVLLDRFRYEVLLLFWMFPSKNAKFWICMRVHTCLLMSWDFWEDISWTIYLTVWGVVQNAQKEREQKLVELLLARLDPYVKGDKERFTQWATAEARQLAEAGKPCWSLAQILEDALV